MGLGLRFVDLDPLRPAALDELGGEAALAEAGFGRDPDDGAVPGLRRLEPPSSTASSSSRPTNREKPRSRERSSRERAEPIPSSS